MPLLVFGTGKKETLKLFLLTWKCRRILKKLSQSDSIEDALDYKAVSKRVKQFIQESQFNLIETAAENVAKIILEEFDVQWLKLRVSKPFAIRGSSNVGVCIERTKDG